jgi:biopolymer transport protein ExbD
MGMKKPEMIPVEVDMVPLIDIISLLLMFLVMVGDMTRSSTAVKMKLPRASEAKSDKELGGSEGRIVVQLKQEKDGRYKAVVENNAFDLVAQGSNQTLIRYLEEQIARRKSKESITLGPAGEVPFPVKLRIPEEAPMREVERVIMTLAHAKLVNVQYAVENMK